MNTANAVSVVMATLLRIGIANRLLIVLLWTLLPLVGAVAGSAAPSTPATLNVGYFGRTLPMIAAQSKGFFAAEGLTVNFLPIASSTQAFAALRDGSYDAALTSVDNVVNYRLNAGNPLGNVLDVKAFFSVDYSNWLTLAGRSGITRVEDFRGKTLAVDAPTSGFAYVLYEVLHRHGLELGVDYKVVSIGGGAQRFQSLIAGTVDGTLLNNGFEIRAQAAGRPLFETVFDIADAYQGSVAASMTAWLDGHSDAAVRFTRAFYAATRWSFDPANRSEAIQLLMSQPNTTQALAERLYAAQTTPRRGLSPYLVIDRRGLRAVLNLRQACGGFERKQNLSELSLPGGGIYTFRYWRRAVVDFEIDEPHEDDSTASGVTGPRPGDGLHDGSLVHQPAEGQPEL
jgi:ABC-type nitrate/sulfonate/bicarbonate transport system substrate-binding protein